MIKRGLINKKGVSPVIATMLLLVITVVLAGLIMAFVLPFVRDKLGDSKECLDVLDGIEFAESKFNCYQTSTPLETGFSIKLKKDAVKGARISLIKTDDSSVVYDINANTPAATLADVRKVGAGGVYGGTALGFPSQAGEQMTYVANAEYARAEIAPTTASGKVCEVTDAVEFVPCLNVGFSS